ncbi:uncharacterized protein METZ01_LOCUS410487, partial [marine metagenome]
MYNQTHYGDIRIGAVGNILNFVS